MIGLKELALLAVLIATLYGRSGVLKSERFQAIWPWIAPVRRPPRRPGAATARRGITGEDVSQAPQLTKRGRPWLPRLDGNRIFWFVTILAATAVAAWVVTRVLIVSRASTGGLH